MTDARPLAMARALCLAALAAFAGLVVFIIVMRIRYPFELEWTTGAMLDHVERVRDGKPLYVAPSAEWTPFLYPPLYYWVCAQLTRVLPELIACRLVSVVSTLGTTALVYAIARRVGASRFASFASALLYVACFGFTLQWYDIERPDSLFVLLVAGSALTLLSSERIAAAAIAGAILGIAFFVKQPATTFLLIVPIALAVTKRARHAAAMAAGAAAVGLPLFAWASSGTEGWFWFYCFTLPASHGVEAKYFTLFFVSDISHAMVLTLGTAAVVAHAIRDRTNVRHVAFAAYVAAGFLASASSRMHLGGWPNVLMFWTVFACPAVGWALDRILANASSTLASIALASMALQAGAFAPDPNESIPGKKDAAYAESLLSRVRQLERGGEVLVLGRGHMTAHRHAHHNALLDAVHAGQPFPNDLREPRKYHAVVVDDPARWDLEGMPREEGALLVLIGKSYFIAERLDDRRPPPVVGYPTMPRWVLRPRENPLRGSDVEVWRRLRVEAGFAERNMRAAQASPDAWSEGLDIEQLAERADAP